jgi:glycosyltransferase involved in cell wall biosynthesis
MSSGERQPRVLALVPTWNAAGFLDRTLDALAAQTCAGLEFLVSDDASADETAAIGERRAAADPRFRVVRQPRNLGWVGNVNALLREAARDGRADYLLFAFQDDLPEPTYVEKCVAALEADPSAVMAFSDIVLVRQDGSVEERSFPALDGVTDRIERARRIARHQGAWWIPNRGVFRASAAEAIGGLRRHREGEFSADWPWLLEMSLLGKFVRIPEKLVTKIYLPTSLSRSWRFGARQWAAVAASAMKAVSRRRLPPSDSLRLRAAIAGFVWKQIRRSARRRLAGAREADPRGSGRPSPGREAGLVSVVLPLHGRFDLAARAIASVRSQAHRPLELIVVDDASPEAFALSPATSDAGIDVDVRVLRLESNSGPGASRDAGRRLARGEFVAYLDSDDFWAPGHLSELVSALRATPDAGMAYSGVMEMRDGRPSGLRRHHDEPCEAILPTLLWKRPWHTSACLWRRELEDAMGGWLDTWHWEDHEHDARAGCLGARVVRVARATCFADVASPGRLSSSSATRRRIEGYGLAMLSMAQRIRASLFFEDAGIRARMRGILLTAAMRASEQGLPRLATRAALEASRWPRPSPALVAASGVGVPLVWLGGGRAAARIFRWARHRVPRPRG